jgi:succinate dehydrogenase / fumarate reductase flavoprotein subunit
VRVDDAQVQAAMKAALAPFDRGGAGENPFRIQQDLQDTMQDLVGIVRVENEMKDALTKLAALSARADRAGVDGHREYHTGWHAALDLRNLLTVSESITRSALERRESRGGHFRDDYPEKSAEFSTFNVATQRGADGSMKVVRRPIPEMPAELKQVIEQEKQ